MERKVSRRKVFNELFDPMQLENVELNIVFKNRESFYKAVFRQNRWWVAELQTDLQDRRYYREKIVYKSQAYLLERAKTLFEKEWNKIKRMERVRRI